MTSNAPQVRTRTPPARPEGGSLTRRSVAASPRQEHPAVRALREYTERQQITDPFRTHYTGGIDGAHRVIEPTYSFYALMRLPGESDMLRQCIDAMVTNCDKLGYRLEFVGKEGDEQSPAAQAEKEMLTGLLDHPNDEYGMQELRTRVRKDRETLGCAFMEVGRDRKGGVSMLAHLPGHSMRMTTKDPEKVEVEVVLPRNGKKQKQRVKRSFRRFVQMIGNDRVWFKEFGDPRKIDPKTGKVDETLTWEDSATEVLMFHDYEPTSPYGLPRWFHQLPAITGNRQAALTNLDYFSDNAIPALALLVSGGMVTQASLDAIEQHVGAARGRQSQNRVVVIEAQGDSAAAGEDGKVAAPKVELKPLAGDRQNDAVFAGYQKDNRDLVRSSFRLPPLFVGLSEDMTYATAKTAYEVADGQVFAPERGSFDDTMNLRILSTLNPRYWAMRSNGPTLADPAAKVTAMETFDKTGALTPNVAIQIANDFLDRDVPKIEKPWANLPMSVVLELVKLKVLPPSAFDDELADFDPPPPPDMSVLTQGTVPGQPAAEGAQPGAKPADKPGAAGAAQNTPQGTDGEAQAKPAKGKAAKPAKAKRADLLTAQAAQDALRNLREVILRARAAEEAAG